MYYTILKDHLGKVRVNVPCSAYLMDDGEMVYLELVSRAPQPVNAIRANIYKNRRTTALVATDVTIYDADGRAAKVFVVPKTRYHTFTVTPKASTIPHHIMLHSGFDRLTNRYLFGGTETEPSPWFARAFQGQINAPFLTIWSSELWKAGIEHDLLKPLKGVGATGWRMSRDVLSWRSVIEEERKAGRLLTPQEKENSLHG